VGGVSEGAGAKAEGSDPFARTNSFACRGGERHPDLLEGCALRGATSERGSWSVRTHVVASPLRANAPMTADVQRAPRRGTSSASATKRMQPQHAREIVRAMVTRPSLGPEARARQSSLRTGRASVRWWGERESITAGQPRVTGRNQHWGCHGRTERGSPHVTAPEREAAWRVEKRKEVEASVPARIKGSGLVARTSIVMLQKSVGDNGLE